MKDVLLAQYGYMQAARERLLGYCAGLPAEDLRREHPAFGLGSIRNLLVHVANTYVSWIGIRSLHKTMDFTPEQTIHDVAAIRPLYSRADGLVGEFLERYGEQREPLLLERNGKAERWAPLQLFTHVLTHECHHKGQVLSLGRLWGYTPADTDIIL